MYIQKKKIISIVNILLIVLSLIMITIIPTKVVSAVAFSNMDWSDYDWIAAENGNEIEIWDKDNPDEKNIVYCYDETKLRPTTDVLYRKGTIHNDTTSVLYEQISGSVLYTQEEVINHILTIIKKGYSPKSLDLQAKFPNYSDEVLFDGTQFAIWAVVNSWSTEEKDNRRSNNPQAMEVADYLLENDSDIDNSNIQVSIFEPVMGADEYQPLLSLTYIADRYNEEKQITVEKKWNGIPRAEQANLPEVIIEVYDYDSYYTYLRTNSKNNWTASFWGGFSEQGPKLIEVGDNGVPMSEEGIVEIFGQKYSVKIQQNNNHYTIINTPVDIEKKYDVSIQKIIKGKGLGLEGAKLKIVEGETVTGRVVTTWISSQNAKEVILKEGNYILIEDEAPTGYKVAKPIEFHISEDGTLDIKNEHNKWEKQLTLSIAMEDEPEIEKTIQIKKIASDTKENLLNANLKIVSEDKGEIVAWNTDGTVKELTLCEGQYKLQEINSPDGYDKADDIDFRITQMGTLEILENNMWIEQENSIITMVDNKIPERIEQSYEIAFSKVELGKVEELENATLQIFSGSAIQNMSNPIYTWNSGKDMYRCFLKEGEYTFVEQAAPNGYEIAEPIEFRVMSNGAIMIKENGIYIERYKEFIRMEDKKTPNVSEEVPKVEIPIVTSDTPKVEKPNIPLEEPDEKLLITPKIDKPSIPEETIKRKKIQEKKSISNRKNEKGDISLSLKGNNRENIYLDVEQEKQTKNKNNKNMGRIDVILVGNQENNKKIVVKTKDTTPVILYEKVLVCIWIIFVLYYYRSRKIR